MYLNKITLTFQCLYIYGDSIFINVKNNSNISLQCCFLDDFGDEIKQTKFSKISKNNVGFNVEIDDVLDEQIVFNACWLYQKPANHW